MIASTEGSKQGSQRPDRLLETLLEITKTPAQFSSCTNLQSQDYQYEFELILLKQIFSVITIFHSNTHLKFGKHESLIIECGHRKAYPDNRIEGFFSNSKSDSFPLLVLVLAVRSYGTNVLQAIAALPDEYRLRLRVFVCDLPRNVSFSSYISVLDSTPKPLADPSESLPILGTRENRDIVWIVSPPSKVKCYTNAKTPSKKRKKSGGVPNETQVSSPTASTQPAPSIQCPASSQPYSNDDTLPPSGPTARSLAPADTSIQDVSPPNHPPPNDNNVAGLLRQRPSPLPEDSNVFPSSPRLQAQGGGDQLNNDAACLSTSRPLTQNSSPQLNGGDTLPLTQNGSHLPNDNRSPQSAEVIPNMQLSGGPQADRMVTRMPPEACNTHPLLESQSPPVKRMRDNGGSDDLLQAGEERGAPRLWGHHLEQQAQGYMRQNTKHERSEGFRQTDDNSYQIRYNVENTPNSNLGSPRNLDFLPQMTENELSYEFGPSQGEFSQDLYASVPPPPAHNDHGNPSQPLLFYAPNLQSIPPPAHSNYGNFSQPQQFYPQNVSSRPPPAHRNYGNFSQPQRFYPQNMSSPPPPAAHSNYGNFSQPQQYYGSNLQR